MIRTNRENQRNLLLDEIESSRQLAPLNWHGVRLEYFKVWSEFTLIAKPFGISLSGQQTNALGHMLVAMDIIDTAIDQETRQPTRLQLCRSILMWMNQKADLFPLHEKVDTDRLKGLREIITCRQIARPFLSAAARVFQASEGKRNSTSPNDLIRKLIDEGQAAAEMTIQLLGPNTNARFNSFLQRIMRIGTIVDTLLDADSDFEKGILQLVPNRFLRWKLKAAIARQLPGLILDFPDRALLWRYCLSYTSAELNLLNVSHRSYLGDRITSSGRINVKEILDSRPDYLV